MSNAAAFELNNKSYVDAFAPEKSALALPPSKHVAVVACMDARLDVAKVFGINEGEAHVIRNAGGRASDALRSVIISQRLLGTRELIVLHHTDCGMLTFIDEALHKQLKEETKGSDYDGQFLPFSDLEKSVIDDVEFLKKSDLVLDVPITGYIYDVKTGGVKKVISTK